jgi:hypothetical protein
MPCQWVGQVSHMGCARQQLEQFDPELLVEASEVLSCCVPCGCASAVLTAAGA